MTMGMVVVACLAARPEAHYRRDDIHRAAHEVGRGIGEARGIPSA